jgi:hypothetical protein
MKGLSARRPGTPTQSIVLLWIRDLSVWIRELPDKGKIADCLGLFALLVLALGLPCFLGESATTTQDAIILQLLGFFLLGTGQLFFLRKKLPSLLQNKRLRLFSRQGWYYIAVLCALLVVLLFLLYLLIDKSHLFMVGVSLCAFLLPFTVSNGWEAIHDRTGQTEEDKRKKIFQAGLPGTASLLLLVGFASLGGRQTPAVRAALVAVPGPENAVSRTASYDKAGHVLNEYATHLLELDLQFSRLARPAAVTSHVGQAKAGYEIKTQEHALERLLDSLDNRGREFRALTAPFRSLLAGHQILSQFQSSGGVKPNAKEVAPNDQDAKPDSIR